MCGREMFTWVFCNTEKSRGSYSQGDWPRIQIKLGKSKAIGAIVGWKGDGIGGVKVGTNRFCCSVTRSLTLLNTYWTV